MFTETSFIKNDLWNILFRRAFLSEVQNTETICQIYVARPFSCKQNTWDGDE